MDNKTLQKLAQRYIGNEFEILAICLGFSQTQLDTLHQLYARQPDAMRQRMLKEWHKMAIQGGEDPRQWLAKEFIDLGKRNDATWFCEDIQDAETYKPKKETLAAIETISFDSRETVDEDSAVKLLSEILHKLAEQSQVHRNPVSQSPGASMINRRECDSIDFSSIKNHGSSKFKKLTDDDVLPASEIDILFKCHKSVGSIVKHRAPGNRAIEGTCFKIRCNLLMTAWHVLKDEEKDSDTSGQLFFKEVGVSFHCDGLSEEEQVHQLLYYNEDMDYAIFSIKGTLQVETDIPLHPLNVFINSDIKYCLIGYGHKNRNDKCIERKCQQISSDVIEEAKNWSRSWVSSKDPNPPVNYTGYEMADKDHNVLINSFLEHGASGSPVIVSDDHGNIYTVAMYLGGLPGYYYDVLKREPALVDEILSQHRFEYAVNVHHIFEDMRSRNPALCNYVFSNR